MTEKYTIADLKKVIKGLKSPPQCDKTMQVKVLSANNGTSIGKWYIDQQFINGHGVVLGGFVASAVDIMMAYAIASKLGNKDNFMSIDLDMTFHRPTFEGEVDIITNVERLGRTLAYITAEVKQNEKLIANGVSSMMIKTQNV